MRSEMETRDDAENGDDAEKEAEQEDHLADVEDGAGCTEIWEHLSEQREE